MTGLKMMEAVDGLSDKMILEFADVQPVRQERVGLLHWLLPVAACLCLLLGAAGLYFMNQQDPGPSLEFPPVNTTQGSAQSTPQSTAQTEKPTQPPVTTAPAPTGNIIWGGPDDSNYGALYYESHEYYGEKGFITIWDSVRLAMNRAESPSDRFGVVVSCMARTDRSEIYERVLKPMGVEESYLETGVASLMASQILTMQCPENMALSLRLEYKCISLTTEYVQNSEQKTFFVEVWLEIPLEVQLEAARLFPRWKEDYEDRNAYLSAASAQVLQECWDYLGLDGWEYTFDGDEVNRVEEDGGWASHNFAYFWGMLDKETVLKIAKALENGEYHIADALETTGWGMK